MGTICQTFLEQEKRNLSKFAFLTVNTKGREHPYVPCEMRTEFQRDRDRIVHCQSFRRLMNKTQVFLAPAGDHYRTRLTHTMEVSQIARIIARSLHLNEDLTEAAALGHDLGHTPFGHSGEAAMQELFSSDFTHYRQSLRVVDKLENGGKGLNLTFEVRDGIVNHTGKSQASTLEGVIVKFADRIAYINHDIDDACRGGVLHTEEIPADLRQILGQTHGERINTMVASVIRASENLPEIKMEPHIQAATDSLRKFLFETVYTSPVVKGEEKKAQEMIARLYEYFCKNPTRMPSMYVSNIEEEGVARCVCDFIAGMTDRYAIETYRELFIPQVWKL